MRTKFLIHYLFSRITNIIQFLLILSQSKQRFGQGLYCYSPVYDFHSSPLEAKPKLSWHESIRSHSPGQWFKSLAKLQSISEVCGVDRGCACVCVGGGGCHVCACVCEAVLVCCAFFLKNRHCLSHDYIFKGKTTKQLYKSMITKLKFTL